jgi:ElaB/YqjD/DUF883 family membrane-anchored ribosome-binding protein
MTETELKTDATEAMAGVKAEISKLDGSLEARVKALEAEAGGYVKAHVVYFVGAICLIVGVVAGHLIK